MVRGGRGAARASLRSGPPERLLQASFPPFFCPFRHFLASYWAPGLCTWLQGKDSWPLPSFPAPGNPKGAFWLLVRFLRRPALLSSTLPARMTTVGSCPYRLMGKPLFPGPHFLGPSLAPVR